MTTRRRNTTTITVQDILDAEAKTPAAFLDFDLKGARSSKDGNTTWNNIIFTKADGTKIKAPRLKWVDAKLCGGIKEKKERGVRRPALFYVVSKTGDFGTAMKAYYDCAHAVFSKYVADGSITWKVDELKKPFSSIIKDRTAKGEMFDNGPAFRINLPTDRDDKKFIFKTHRLVQSEEKATASYELVDLTPNNVHSILKSSMSTSGQVNISQLVFHTKGSSIPAKVDVLLIKDLEPRVPDIEDFFDEDEKKTMVTVRKNEESCETFEPEESEGEDEAPEKKAENDVMNALDNLAV